VVDSRQRRIAALEKEQQALTKQLQGETQRTHEQQLTLLCSIPGVGLKSACLLLAELGDIKRFSTAAKLVAFVGLTPPRYESGSSVDRQSTISRMGSPHLRRTHYMPSLVAVRYNPLLKNTTTSSTAVKLKKLPSSLVWQNCSASSTVSLHTVALLILTTPPLDFQDSISLIEIGLPVEEGNDDPLKVRRQSAHANKEARPLATRPGSAPPRPRAP